MYITHLIIDTTTRISLEDYIAVSTLDIYSCRARFKVLLNDRSSFRGGPFDILFEGGGGGGGGGGNPFLE